MKRWRVTFYVAGRQLYDIVEAPANAMPESVATAWFDEAISEKFGNFKTGPRSTARIRTEYIAMVEADPL